MSQNIKDALSHGDFYFAKGNLQNRNKDGTTMESEVSFNTNPWNCLKGEEQPPTLTAPLCDIVPLYGCEMLKSHVVATANTKGRLQSTLGPEANRRRCSSIQLQGSCSLNSNFTTQSGNTNGGISCSHNGKAEQKSYVDLHYAKIGYPYVKGGRLVKREETMDTVRGICGDETNRSNESVPITSDDGELFEDAQSCLSDTTSFYENFMEKEIMLNASGDNFFDFKSVSQVSTVQRLSKRNIGKKTKSIISVPLLGSLGPDPLATKVKMENLRKQQAYGQKASEQNRIKIMEKKILCGLKSELKKSIDIDKQYFNKFIENGFSK